MEKKEKMKKINELIEQMRELAKDREFTIFFSAVALDENRAGMYHAFYTDGQFPDINMAIGIGISVLADQASKQGVDRMELLETVVNGIGDAEEIRMSQRTLDEVDDRSGDEGESNS